MNNMRRGNHTISQMQVHIVWVTKYRYPVLKGELQKRCRELIIQICDAEDIRILKGVVSKDHVHMHIEYPPSKAISDIVDKTVQSYFHHNYTQSFQLLYSHDLFYQLFEY